MRRTLALLATILGATLGVASAADRPASPVPPWRDADDLPLPDAFRSATIEKGDLPVLDEPRAEAKRRGSIALGARVPLYGAKRAQGCTGRYLLVGPAAWICQDGATIGTLPALDADDERFLEAKDGFPYRYYFVKEDGSHGYRNLADADEAAPEAEFQPGFALAIAEETTKGSEKYGLTNHGYWVPMRELGAVKPLAFHGEELADGATFDFGWVVEDRAPTFSKPAPSAKTKATRARFERVPLGEETTVQKQTFVRSGDAWLRAKDVRRASLAKPPPGVRAGEHWIDIELATQTLVAYEGEKPVFATLVSTGLGAQGTELATPIGTHRIWVKLKSSNMDNLEDETASKYYAIEDVPWVQYFAKAVGLHAAFWHHQFGHAHSHGCVNLAPLDAQRLFAFTSPHMPAGWTATLPGKVEPGTVIRVR